MNRLTSECGKLKGEVLLTDTGAVAIIYLIYHINKGALTLTRRPILYEAFTDSAAAYDWVQEKLKNVAWTLLQS